MLLVGDAAGYVDALTGEGLSTGLASASAAGGRPGGRSAGGLRVGMGSQHPADRVLTEILLAVGQRGPVPGPPWFPSPPAGPEVFAAAVNLLA